MPAADATTTATAPAAAPSGTRSAVRTLTHRVLAMVVEELSKPEMQKHVRSSVVDPLIKMIYTQLMPYFMVVAVVFIAILLMSMMTLTLSALFYFRRTKVL